MGTISISGCSDQDLSARTIRERRSAVIEGERSDALSGVAHISHARGSVVCSGFLIARDLVVTGKHCVFLIGDDGDEALPSDGFRVGFGDSEERLELRSVAEVTWVGSPGEHSVADAVEAGEDVAILRLAEAAPSSEQAREIMLDAAFTADQPVVVAGYGVRDHELGLTGLRAMGEGRIAGLDMDTGTIEVVEASACFGDSGGPILDDQLERILGVISQVGGSDASLFCDVGRTYASTAANERVRRMIARACASVGGCGEAEPGSSDIDAGSEDAGDQSSVDDDAGVDAGAVDTSERSDGAVGSEARTASDTSSCAVTPSAGSGATWRLLGLAAATAIFLRRRRRRAAG